MAELVDARDLKSLTYCRCVSSSLIPSTKSTKQNKIMKQEFFIKVEEDIITPTVFALMIVEQGIPLGKAMWCAFGSVDSIKCIAMSHNCKLERLNTSVEGNFQQFVILENA